MANQYYHLVHSVDDLKRMCPNINFDNCQIVSMGDDVSFGGTQQVILSQDQQIIINDSQPVPQLIYQQQPPPPPPLPQQQPPQQPPPPPMPPQSVQPPPLSVQQQQPIHNQLQQQQMRHTQYIIQEEEMQTDAVYGCDQQEQIIYTTANPADINSLSNQQQQLCAADVQQNMQIQPNQHIQTEPIQSPVVMHYQQQQPPPPPQPPQQQQQQQQIILNTTPQQTMQHQQQQLQQHHQPAQQVIIQHTPVQPTQHIVVQQTPPNIVIRQQQQPQQHYTYEQKRITIPANQIRPQQLVQHQVQQNLQQQQQQQQQQPQQQQRHLQNHINQSIRNRAPRPQQQVNFANTVANGAAQQRPRVRPTAVAQQMVRGVPQAAVRPQPRANVINPSQIRPTTTSASLGQIRPAIRAQVTLNRALSPLTYAGTTQQQQQQQQQSRLINVQRCVPPTLIRTAGISSTIPKKMAPSTTGGIVQQYHISPQQQQQQQPQPQQLVQQQQPPQQQQNNKIFYKQQMTNTSVSDFNELDDLEESITAAKIVKKPSSFEYEQQSNNVKIPAQSTSLNTSCNTLNSTQPVGQQNQTGTTATTVVNNTMQQILQNQTQPINNQTNMTIECLLANDSPDDENKIVTLVNGRVLSLADYKRIHRLQQEQLLQQQPMLQNSTNQIQPQPQPQPQQDQQQQTTTMIKTTIPRMRAPSARGGYNQTRGQSKKTYSTNIVGQQQHQQITVQQATPTAQLQVQSSLQQQQQQQQQLQQQPQTQQHQEPPETRESAKMLVILQSGEQRLITFTLPKESCTVQELLEQVGVPFTPDTNIQCVSNPGVNIDYLVTVGVDTTSEVISAAENSLQMKQLQQQQQQAQQLQHRQQLQQQQQQFIQQQQLQQQQQQSLQQTTPPPQPPTLTNVASATTAAVLQPAAQVIQQQQQSQSTSTQLLQKTLNPAVSKVLPMTKKLNSPELPVKDPPPKYVEGMLAVCSNCGMCNADHAKCHRCHTIFKDDIKQTPVTQADLIKTNKLVTPASLHTTTLLTTTVVAATEKQKKELELAQKKHQISVELLKNNFSALRNRNNVSSTTSPLGSGPLSSTGAGITTSAPIGSGSSGRKVSGTTRAKPKPEEPVILTLSSDDEDDQSNSSNNVGQVPKSSNNHCGSSNSNVVMPFHFEPTQTELEMVLPNFVRENITDIQNSVDNLYTALTARTIRIGSYAFEPTEKVIITTKGIRIVAPNVKRSAENCILDIQRQEVVKILYNFSKVINVIFIYTLGSCSQHIRDSLEMSNTSSGAPYYNSSSMVSYQSKIVILLDSITEESKSVIRSTYKLGQLEEMTSKNATELLARCIQRDKNNQQRCSSMVSTGKYESSASMKDESTDNIRQILIYPQGKGGISINTEDYMCLAIDQYLNDVIIDFYLSYLLNEVLSIEERNKTHVFSTFFYKRLTTMSTRQRQTAAEKDVKLTASQKRHARVKNWTKSVNLFEKDYIIIPINEQSHWFLAIVCFPALKGPVTYDTGLAVKPLPPHRKRTERKRLALQIGNTTITPVMKRDMVEAICLGDDSERDEAEADDSDLASDDSSGEMDSSTDPPAIQPIKQPCILIFDSLAGASRSRVVATLRDYLTCEYKAKIHEPSSHVFNKFNIPGHSVKVPQQNNFTDCGLFLLQYVEAFFQNPIKDYRLPIKHLQHWFDTMMVTRKREEISVLLQDLVQQFNPDKLPLPEITFPTLNGKLIDLEDGFTEDHDDFEEEEEEELDEDMDADEMYTTAETESPESSPDKSVQQHNTISMAVVHRATEAQSKTADSEPILTETSSTTATTTQTTQTGAATNGTRKLFKRNLELITLAPSSTSSAMQMSTSMPTIRKIARFSDLKKN